MADPSSIMPEVGGKHRHAWNLHYRPCRDFTPCSDHPRLCERCGYQRANHPTGSDDDRPADG